MNEFFLWNVLCLSFAVLLATDDCPVLAFIVLLFIQF